MQTTIQQLDYEKVYMCEIAYVIGKETKLEFDSTEEAYSFYEYVHNKREEHNKKIEEYDNWLSIRDWLSLKLNIIYEERTECKISEQ